jgi:hypothetical protein
MLLIISHQCGIHFGIYSSVPEDRFLYHFFLQPKIRYCMVARLSYTHTIWYHTPTSRYHLERGGTKIKISLLVASSHTSVRRITTCLKISLLQANFTVHMDRFLLWQFSVGISVNSFAIHGGGGNGRDDSRSDEGCFRG